MADENHSGAADAAYGAEASGGLPQLDFSTFPNQIFWLVVSLIAIYLILTRVALPRISSVLAERQGTITNDIAAAEDLKVKAEEAEQAYEKALADARSEAQKIAAEAKAEIQGELDDAMAKANAEIAARAAESEARIAEINEGAEEAVKDVAKDAAREVLAVLGGKADARGITSAINARVKGGA